MIAVKREDLIHGTIFFTKHEQKYVMSCVHGQDWVSYYNLINVNTGGRAFHKALTLDDLYDKIVEEDYKLWEEKKVWG